MDDVPFQIEKVRTIDPKTGEPFPHTLAATYRSTGIDEVMQARNIIAGRMSTVGPRPLTPADKNRMYEEASHDRAGSALVDKYRATVVHARPGLVSSVGIAGHAGRLIGPDERLFMDIADYEQASLVYDLSLMAAYLDKAIKGNLVKG